ncbi:MAG: TonB-dependent receptor [candidate division Zixibacteria bacterium]
MLALNKAARLIILLSFLILLCVSNALGSTTGKIAGIVANAETGEELKGATIRVQGTRIATMTDPDGEFYIINLPVGVYTLDISILGYESAIVQQVRVLMDLTTPVEINLNISPVDLNKSVTVYAKRPLIQRDKTSSGAIVTRDDIMVLADARNVSSIISNMSGAVVGGDNAIHVRGGRWGTLSYFFDGFSIQDPFYSTMGMRIVPDALEELSLTSGGLAPEYGEALAGVVNAITREGTDEFRGRLKIFDGASHRYDVYTGDFSGLERINNHSISLDLSGPIGNFGGRTATFFTALEYERDDGYLPHNRYKSYSGVGKIVAYPTDKTKLTFNGAYYTSNEQRYDHRDNNLMSYDFNLDGSGKYEDKSYLFGIKFDYNKSSNTVYSFKANKFRTERKLAPEHLFDLYWKDWPGYREDENGDYNGTIQDSNYVRSPEYYYWGYTTGDDFFPVYKERWSAYSGASFSLLSQLDKFHQLKFGWDLRHYELHWDSRQFFNAMPYGETYTAFPWIGAAYLQDKIELNDLIVNIGMRFDYLNSDAKYWNDPIEHDFKKNAKAKYQVSPRLGISHPVSENSVLHFNYGYLFQPPQGVIMYTNLKGELDSGFPLFGNPDLKAEKSIYYELGLAQLLNENIRMQVTTYYKDISNMVGAREVVDGINNYTVYTNSDYGSTKGVDLILETTNQKLFNWSLNYSYMIARGNASDPNDWYYNYYTIPNVDDRLEIPTREYPLAYDQRHSLSAVIDFRVPRFEKLRVLGKELPSAWGINLLARYGSGLAYTRTDKNGRPVGSLNDERLSSTIRFDSRFNKDFFLTDNNDSYLTLYVEVVNMFNRKNVRRVYTSTGKPDDDGYEVLNVLSATYEEEVLYHSLLERDPQNYEPPRQLRFGLEINF